MRVVVTRAAHQAEELAAPLRDKGFEILLLPVIAIAPPANPEALRRSATNCDTYDWIVFSSVNAVKAFAGVLPALPQIARIATVGAATRKAAEDDGLIVSLTPDKYIAEALVEAFGSEDLTGRRILIPSAAVTRDILSSELRKRGAHVDLVEAYRNVMPPEAAESAAQIFRDPFPAWVLFASSSSVDNLVELVGVPALKRTRIASIGPATSATARKHGLEPQAEATEHSVQGLIDAVS